MPLVGSQLTGESHPESPPDDKLEEASLQW